MKPWENVSYQTITNVSIQNQNIDVYFDNGDQVKLALKTLLPSLEDDVLIKVSPDNLNYTSYKVSFEVGLNKIDIPWDKIRLLSDKEFAKFIAEQAEEQAKLVGIKLKKLREKKAIKSNYLSEISGISAQTISRIEKGHQDISFSTLKRLLAAMGYGLKDLASEEIELEKSIGFSKTFRLLLTKLSKAGVDPNFVTKKIIPVRIQSAINNSKEEQPELLLDEAAGYLSNVYGWSIDDIWSNKDLELESDLVQETYFKKNAKSNYNQIKAYIPYAHYLAKISINAFKKRELVSFPGTIEEFQLNLKKSYGGLNIKPIIDYAWDMGICVVPLDDPGIFYGAAWKINDGYAIILKQKNQSHARWIFDLLHELFHVFNHLNDINDILVESAELSPISKVDDLKEKEANSFANQVLFNGNAEEIAQEVVGKANGKIEFLPSAVTEIAQKRGVREDSLANYLAYRLSYQGRAWWSAADTFQVTNPRPFDIAKEIYLKNININGLEPIDYNLLATAYSLNVVL